MNGKSSWKVVIQVILALLSLADAQLSGPNVCSYRVSRTYSYTVTVPYRGYESYRTCCSNFMWCWSYCTRYRAVTRYRSERRYSITYSTHYRCCSGWTQTNNRCQIPICNSPSCLHGTCILPNTCSCNTGYESPATGCRTDINECSTSNGGCDQTCHNYPGGHSCSCRRGYTLHSARRCQDIDECTISNQLCECYDPANNPGCNATCHNTIGSYRCSCSGGYRLTSTGKCADTNECQQSNAGCAQICSNTPGSYRCSCRIGYQLQSDRKSCNDTNECQINKGGCEHSCINMIGSFNCLCRPGHVLDYNGRTCSDINECLSHPHGCQHICNNYKGGFFCSCRVGYRLSADNKTCSDINECDTFQPGTNITLSKCTQNCHNAIGSYTCSCNTGYRLAADGKTCNDINECTEGSNGCNQTCINTLGSYVCKCLKGYRLNADGKACDALPCIRHPPVINGKGTCFAGKTGDICRFNCDLGFDFRGSNTRKCLNNQTWSGSLPTCSRKHCNQLSPPNNGWLALPCFKYYQASCNLHCNTGYFVLGKKEQTCMASRNNTMYWSNSATSCREITVCAPNPCKHNGKCHILNKEKFQCHCSGTGYKGQICEIGIVTLPTFTTLQPGITYNLTVHAKPDNGLKINISSNDNRLAISPSTIIFNSVTTTAQFQLHANFTGMISLSYSLSGSSAKEFEAPNIQSLYFQDHTPILGKVISNDGSLSKGCYNKSIQLDERKNVDVDSHSTSPWNDQAEEATTNGVLIVDINKAALPASLVGSSIISNHLINGQFGDFITKHSSGSSSGPNNTSAQDSVRCVSEEPSIAYLSEIVQVNAFPKTVADAVNQNTPTWVNLIPEQTVKTFDIQDFEARILKGQDIKVNHTKCGDVLTAIEDNEQYYMYLSNQKMLIHVNEEDVDVGSRAPICIFRSVSENETVIGFTNTSKVLKTLESSTGWVIKANGIQFKNTGMVSGYNIFGQFSTEMSSNFTQVYVSINGHINLTVTNETAFSTDGVSAIGSMHATGKIFMNVASSSPSSKEKLTFIGQGNASLALTGRTFTDRELSVILNREEHASSRALSNGSVYLDRKSQLIYRLTVKYSGGEIISAQNKTRYHIIYNLVNSWAMETKSILDVIESDYPKLRSLTGPIATNLKTAKSKAMQMSLNANKTMGSSIYQPLIKLKNLVILIERQMQVLSLKHRHASSSISEINYMAAFELSVNGIKQHCRVPLERKPVSRSILSRSLVDRGMVCLEKLCFRQSEIEIVYETSSEAINKRFGMTLKIEQCTAIIGKIDKEIILGGLVSVPNYGFVLQVINRANVKQGFLNGTIEMYGKREPITVKHAQGILQFSSSVLLPDGSQSNLFAKADITKIVNENDLVFEMKVQTTSTADIVKKINHSLKQKLIIISEEISTRINGLQKAVKISEQQKNKAVENQIEKTMLYKDSVEELRQMQARINQTKAENTLLKSQVIKEMKVYDSAIINYTKSIEQCPPRVCVSKCIPGLIRSICFKERYEHVITQKCSLRKKTYTQTEFTTVSSQRQFVTHSPETTCNTRCPPLTGFFRSISGKRKRRDLSANSERGSRSLVRRKRAIFKFLLKKIAIKLITKGTSELFGYLGGENGKLGSQIGSYLPGPLGIVGSIVGGVIGSIFGKCDELCRTRLVPQLNQYIHHEKVKELKSLEYKESLCTDIPRRQKLGYTNEQECFKWSNCSEALTDVECLSHNEICRTIRLLLKDKITRQSHLAPIYTAYQRNSLQLEAFELEEMRIVRERENAYQSLRAAKVASSKANYTYNATRKALAQANKLLADKLKLSKLVERHGEDVISVQNTAFSYRHSVGVKAPMIIYLSMDIVQKDGKFYQVRSLYDFGNDNQSKVDAVQQILRAASSKDLSRKRRETPSSQSIDSLISVDEVTQNLTANRCREVEEDSLYLIEVAMILRDGALQFQEMQQAIKDSQNIAENHTKSAINVAVKSDQCSEDFGCNSQLLVGLYTNATTPAKITTNITLTWESKQAETFANAQQFTDNQNFTQCGGVIDCVQMAITSTLDTIQHDNSNLSKVARKHFLELQPYFNQIFEDSTISANQTKHLANKILKSIELSSARRLFCDPPPVILKDLPMVLVVTNTTVSSLAIIVESIHQLTFKWMKNGLVTSNGNSNTFIFSNNNRAIAGYYNCEISNKFGKVISNTVKVEYQEKPLITKHPQGVTKTIRAPNALVRLICNATGQPPPSIAWHFTPFNSSTETVLKGNETMFSMNITTVRQSGFYRCIASNNQGKANSHAARVHVKESMVAKFSTGISFIVVLKTFGNFTNNTMKSNNITGEQTVNQSKTMQTNLPQKLSENDTTALENILSKQMNITKKRIRNIAYTRHTKSRAFISFEITMKNMDSLLQTHNDWTKMSEDMVMARKGLLILTIWLYTFYSSISSSLNIGHIQTDVLPETMESTMNEASCPDGYSLNSNGFICESCTAGTMYVAGFGCEPCPLGTYQPDQKMLACTSCQTNYTTKSPGGVDVRDCVPIDIDECSISPLMCQCYDPINNPRCKAFCHNTIGSYECSCSGGYQLDASGKCIDLNECLNSNGGCVGICSNTPGSYRCSCQTGYQLESDGKNCRGIRKPTTPPKRSPDVTKVDATTDEMLSTTTPINDKPGTKGKSSDDQLVVAIVTPIVVLIIIIVIVIAVFMFRKQHKKPKKSPLAFDNEMYHVSKTFLNETVFD